MSKSVDNRFSKFKTDPKFRSVPKKETKVKIDPRFRSVFKTKSWASSDIPYDKRGRPKVSTVKEDLEKYYRIDEDDDDDDEDDDDKIHNMNVDYARGEGTPLSDSSSEESSEDEEDENESSSSTFDKWGELDHDSERLDIVSKRLAVCNMDWDRVNARDIYLAMSSFCPPKGSVVSVKIYLSDFGKVRLEEENKLGPEELRKERDPEHDDSNSDSDLDQDEIDKRAMERIRKYQVNRLKYYYAVVEFDSVSSSERVYEECDGMEYELSACRFDLRFIPDDVEFSDREPTDICDSVPSEYKPKGFVTTALQQGTKVELTWDETDPERIAAMQRAFEKDDDDDDDEAVKAYIDFGDGENEKKNERDSEVEDEDEDEDDGIEKYRALLADIEEKEQKKEEEKGNMEITWNPDAGKDRKKDDKLSPWEQYLEKKKEKMKSKRDKKKNLLKETKQEEEEVESSSFAPFSDDELPEGIDDPFFNSASKKKKKTKKKGKKNVNDEDDNQEKADLELMVMDSDEEDNKRHFDYKEIVKNETKSGKKKRRKKQNQTGNDPDSFNLDLKDSRFSAIFVNPDYNVDPSHPNFKKTKSMQQIITEKQKRIISRDDNNVEEQPLTKKPKVSEIDQLVKSVKMKTKAQKKIKKKKS